MIRWRIRLRPIQCAPVSHCIVFFFNDTATTEIYTLSLHDALPISAVPLTALQVASFYQFPANTDGRDRKSTRLNYSHMSISYAVFCLKKTTYTSHGTRDPNRIHQNNDPLVAARDQMEQLVLFFVKIAAAPEIYTLSLRDALPI